MDRLIIESILADVNSISLAEDEASGAGGPLLVLDFKSLQNDQVAHAFAALKELAKDNNVSVVICKTLVAGMYDLEIITAALDEPIRICNKVIGNELLEQLEVYLEKGVKPVLTTNVSEEENWIPLFDLQIKDCNAEQQGEK